MRIPNDNRSDRATREATVNEAVWGDEDEKSEGGWEVRNGEKEGT